MISEILLIKSDVRHTLSDLLTRLEAAVVWADMTGVEDLIEEVKGYDTAVAQYLLSLANQLSYPYVKTVVYL